MKIQFVSHSSIIVKTKDAVIWKDPWLFGMAFNDSWSLLPEPFFLENWLDYIDYIWISHEHPDHFHIPTLRSLPDKFKKRVSILFQENNSNKLPDALRNFGYENIILLSHGKFQTISPGTEVWCYQVGQMDSVLGIRAEDKTLLNINDAEFGPYDIKLIRSAAASN